MKKMIRLALLTAILWLCAPSLGAQTIFDGSSRVDSALFAYRNGGIVLYDDYSNNAQALARSDQFLRSNRPAILSGSAHVELLSYIPSWQVGSVSAINLASLQASVVRAYLLTQYGIPHERCTFAIDTTQNLSNQVLLQVVSGPIPRYANCQINYSEGGAQWTAAEAVRAYTTGVPYASYLMIMAQRNIYFQNSGGALYALRDTEWGAEDWDQLAANSSVATLALAAGINLYIKTPEGTYLKASATDVDSGVNVLYTKTAAGTFALASEADILAAAKSSGISSDYTRSLASVAQTRAEPYTQGASGAGSAGYRDYPVFGIKTNGLYWLAALPNLELEFFFAKAMSIVIEGQYTWLSQYLPKESAYYTWGVGLEVRHWFERDKHFQGWYMGAYVHLGQYDFKFGHVGNQGDYYGGGFSAGYLLPIGKHFNLEFGLGAGYVHYINSDYVWSTERRRHEWIDPLEPKKEKWSILPTKAKVSFVWKF